MKVYLKYILAAGVIVPLVLLMWPFAMWNEAASLVLRVIAALCTQTLFCVLGLPKVMKLLPFIGALCLALWGAWLYFTSPHWIRATLWDLTVDYVSPAIACAGVLAIRKLRK